MNRNQWLTIGLSTMLLSLMLGMGDRLPALAQTSPTQSDVGGTNVFNNPVINFGRNHANGQLPAAIQSLQTAISALLNNAALSPNTQSALNSLVDRLNQLNQTGTTQGLDAALKTAAANLSKDLTQVYQACDGGNRSDTCTNLNSLVDQLNSLLSNLENLRSVLQKEARSSRPF